MADNAPALELARALIRRPSVTPEDAGCQDLIAERLEAAGFAVDRLRFGAVDNLWAVAGESGPLLCLAGHTDVVPAGPAEQWSLRSVRRQDRRRAYCTAVAQPT